MRIPPGHPVCRWYCLLSGFDPVIKDGVAYVLFAFDVGLSIALDAAEKSVKSMTERTPIKHQRRAPKYFDFQPIPLRVKPVLADRIPAYLQNCRQNVVVMLDALDRVDFETVTSLGHQMRGSGGAFGFQAITDIGAALQEAAESADNDVSRKWVGELSKSLDRVEIISD